MSARTPGVSISVLLISQIPPRPAVSFRYIFIYRHGLLLHVGTQEPNPCLTLLMLVAHHKEAVDSPTATHLDRLLVAGVVKLLDRQRVRVQASGFMDQVDD